MTSKLQIAQAGVNVQLLKCLGNAPFVAKSRTSARLKTSSKIVERSIRLPVELDRTIGWLSKQTGQSKSAWIRAALFKAME